MQNQESIQPNPNYKPSLISIIIAFLSPYLPSLFSPFGMMFYSFIAYIFIFIIGMLRRRYVHGYISQQMRDANIKARQQQRKKRGQEARRMLQEMEKKGL